MTEHISEADLLLAFDGELPPEREEAVLEHQSVCAACAEKFARLAFLSQEVAMVQCPPVAFRPEEIAVAALLSRIDHVRAEKKINIGSRWLVWANSRAAVAAAITCIFWLSAVRGRDHAVGHPAAVYDFDQAVPAGYVSLP